MEFLAFALWLLSGYSGLDLLIYVLAFSVSIISLTFMLTWISSKTPNSLIPIVITHFSFNASLNLVDARGLGLGPTLSLLTITAGIYLVTAILVWSASGWSTRKHKETKVKSTKTVKEAYAFLGLTLALSYFVFWGPPALFKIPTISFVSDVKGPVWAIALLLVGGFVPSLLAIFLTWKKEGVSGLRLLGRRIIQFKLGWRWYVFTFLIVMAGTAGQLTINKLLGNTFNGYLFGAQLGSFLPLLILGPVSEEIGWRGYALGRLQTRWNALTSSLIVSLFWALWHLPLFMMVGTSQHESGVPFIGFLLKLMASSIIYTWLYNNTKQSLWSAILLHWLYTYAAQVLSSGVTQSPLYNWLEYLPYVTMAAIVVLIWKYQILSRPQKSLGYSDIIHAW